MVVLIISLGMKKKINPATAISDPEMMLLITRNIWIKDLSTPFIFREM